MFTDPTIADFKAYFSRDFPYGTTPAEVMDADILKGIQDAEILISQDLYSTQPAYMVGFLNLAAHYMVMSLRASNLGVQGAFSWLQSSKSVGSVSASYQIPQRILDNPEWAMLTLTNYGVKFLFQILPQLTGQIFAVGGATQP